MSEQTAKSTGTTQPIKPVKKKFRINWRGLLLGTLGLIVLVGLGGLGGYQQAIGDRTSAKATVVSKQTTDQYALAVVDSENGNYDAARQRLEFIIQSDPGFPGASELLTKVLMLAAIPTVTITPTLTPTVDLSGVEEIFQRAQQYVNIMDWPNALANLDTLRKKDATYRAAEVDSMYYFSLRNYGSDLIKQGNLEGGIYQLTLAERFGPLDNTANGLREAARSYILAASFWELDWKNAVLYFQQVYAGWPSLWDGTMTASERYRIATMRYGDDLFADQQYCAAAEQYQISQSLGNLDEDSYKRANQAYQKCFPPTPIVPPTPFTIP
jgi:tetratricopeptide (TPR) repeat protein